MNRGTKDPSKTEIQIVDTLVVLCVRLDPSGPRIRCLLCGWSPRKDDRWACCSCRCRIGHFRKVPHP